jgi:olefin beta-lactone synthetase
VHVPGIDGVGRTWHVLDNGRRPDTRVTLLCVHGNPTWSYLFRDLVAQAPEGVRVVASTSSTWGSPSAPDGSAASPPASTT